MYREVLNELAAWKDKVDRKPLLIVGAKGVGKTWTAKDFGEGFYDNYVIIDLKQQNFIKYLFEDDFNAERVEKMLSVACGSKIAPGETLIILENVDTVKNIEKLLEFFGEQMGDYHICMTTLCEERYGINSSHVNDVDIIHLYPLSFSEFLLVNKEAELCKAIENNAKEPLTENKLKALRDYLKLYYFVGGMPSVVKCWLETQNIAKVREEKKKILETYCEEFKALNDSPFAGKVLQIWNSMGNQLLKENKKFQYGVVKITARAREYSDAVSWLIENSYLNKPNRIREPKSPAAQYEDKKSFELFLNDVGLLSEIYNMAYSDISNAFETNNDYMKAMTEQFAYQELRYNKEIGELWYWISDATAKIEFLFEDSGIIIPIEINLTNNTKAQSIKVFKARYNPPMIIKITMDRFSMESGVMELPLFSVWHL